MKSDKKTAKKPFKKPVKPNFKLTADLNRTLSELEASLKAFNTPAVPSPETCGAPELLGATLQREKEFSQKAARLFAELKTQLHELSRDPIWAPEPKTNKELRTERVGDEVVSAGPAHGEASP